MMPMLLLPLLMVADPGTDAPLFPKAEHDLAFETPATVWDEAVPLGNGILGALLWGDGAPVRVSLDRTDLWDLRPVPEYHSEEYNYRTMRQWAREGRIADLLRVYDNPYNRTAPTKIPAGRIELRMPEGTGFASTGLNLMDATGGMTFKNGAALRVWIHATEAVGFIAARGAVPELHLMAPAFGGMEEGAAKPAIVAGDLAQLGYPDPVESAGEGWAAYEQEGWGGFRFAVHAAWTNTENGWLAAWSVASTHEGDAPATLARDRVERALNELAPLRETHEAWWKGFWSQSGLRVPNARIERQWYLDTYKFGAATRRGAPPITLQGPWTADDGKLPPWKGDYHHDLNTQLSYWPCYSGNRLEDGSAFLAWLWDTRENCREWTRRFFDMPGLNVPMTADLNNHQIGGWRQYTHSATTAAWLAHHFYLHWRYSGDRVFLADRAYPYLRDCAVFLEAVTNERDSNGLRTLPLSASPEINDNRPEAWFPTITNYDLALIRWTFEKTAELAGELKLPDAAAHWRKRLAEMPELSRGEDGRLLVARDHPLRESHRHFSHLMALHPLGLIDPSQGEAARQTFRASLDDLERLGTDYWCGYSFAWLANLAARGRDGIRAARALETFPHFTLRNSFHCNGDQSGAGLSKFTYRPFTLEGNFAAAAGLQEMLIQSHTGVIEVFPAIPETWRDAAFATLRAEGGVLVSARQTDGKPAALALRAETPQERTLRWIPTGQQFTISLPAGETVRFSPDAATGSLQRQ